jgi:hypothetical protein
MSVLGFLDGNSLTNRRTANVFEVASPLDLAVGADPTSRPIIMPRSSAAR